MWRAVSGRNNRGHFENAGVHDVYIKRALLPQVYSGFLHRDDSRSQVNAIIFPLSITPLSYQWCTDQQLTPSISAYSVKFLASHPQSAPLGVAARTMCFLTL